MKIAPSLPRASAAITVSGSIGMKMPTRSPCCDAQIAQGVRQPVRLGQQLAEGEAAHRAVVPFPDQGECGRPIRRRRGGRARVVT